MLPQDPNPRASIVIRTYNEGRHLPGVLNRIAAQDFRSHEVIVVDSGSTDGTVEIARLAGARIQHIRKEEFTFGRSLNRGCAAARGEFLVFVSGHCYPMRRDWLGKLLEPFADPRIALSYGKQRGGKTTKFSEHCHFAKTFPNRAAVPQEGFFCNNANCAIRRCEWERRHFDETLTGLEDLDWAKWAVSQGHLTAYAAEAGVYHLHDETWAQVFRRYEREAIALRRIMPEIHFSFWDFVRLTALSIAHDARRARSLGKLKEIVAFRFLQYRGTYAGNHYHKKLSQDIKEKFFYPTK